MISNELQDGVAAIVIRHRRLAVLRILVHDASNGSSNDGVLLDVLEDWALGCTHAALQTCLRHLEQFGFVTTTLINGRMVVRITQEGHEVAIGKAQADGVQPYDVNCPY